MKLKKDFVTQDFGSSVFLIGVGSADFHGVAKGNKSSAYVLELLKTETTREEIINKMYERYDAPREVLAEDVDRVLEALRSIDAIEE